MHRSKRENPKKENTQNWDKYNSAHMEIFGFDKWEINITRKNTFHEDG